MPRQILLRYSDTGANERTELFAERPADSEEELRSQFLQHPELIPAEDMDVTGPMLVVGRETAVASGRIDLVCIARSGELMLVEFKTGPANPDYRHTLAQLIDYAAQLWRGTLEQFESSVVQQHLGISLDKAIQDKWLDSSDNEVMEIKAKLTDQLRSGAFTYVVAAQRFTDAMLRSVEYLNDTSESRYFAIELVRFDGSIGRAYESRVVARPARVASGVRAAAVRLDQAEMLERLENAEYRLAIESLLEALPNLGFRIEFVSKGCSIRARTPLRADPISLGWFYPPSEEIGFLGSRDLTLGYDLVYEGRLPLATPVLRRFVSRAEGLAGASRLQYQSPLVHFAPHVVNQPLVDEIKELLVETHAELQSLIPAPATPEHS